MSESSDFQSDAFLVLRATTVLYRPLVSAIGRPKNHLQNCRALSVLDISMEQAMQWWYARTQDVWTRTARALSPLPQLPRLTKMAAKSKVEVFGLLNDINYVRARCCAEDIYRLCPDKLEEPVTVGMLQFEWDIYIDEKKRELRGEAWQFNEKAIAFVNGELVGGPDDFVAWAKHNFNFEEFRPTPLHMTLTEEGYVNHLNAQKHDFVYMDVSIGEEAAGRLIIELFSDKVPKTCANFMALCTGEKGVSEESDYKLHYLNSLFHRIVPNGWIQGGDVFHGRGNGGESIYGAVFEDENFSVHHDRRGIVGMANKGRHTNQSQFYITLQPTPWMDTRYVAFGQVIEGTETLGKMEVEETMNERPRKDIKVTACGPIYFQF